jgi:hypothetical protein
MKAFYALSPEGVAERRGKLSGTLLCYDNRSIETLAKNGILVDRPVLIPGLDEKIQPFLSELSRERNLLLLHNTVDDVELDSLISLARGVVVLVDCMCRNRMDLIEPRRPGYNTVSMPCDASHPFGEMAFEIRADSGPLTIDDFKIRI